MKREELIALVKDVQNGNENAFTQMYEVFHNDLYYYIFKTVNDKELASDLTQDTFIEILQSIRSLQEPAAFVTWSRQIAFRRCTAYFKKRRDLIADEDEDGYSVFDTLEEDNAEFIPGEALDKEEFKNIILSILDTLPEEQRSAIMMRYFDELSIPEIAKIQCTSEGTVKSRLNYGRKAIAKAVEDYEKKYDIKLHSAGILPILLWVTRQQKLAKGISLTTGTASATGAAAAIAVASATTATGATAAVVTTGVAVKAVGTALAMKIAAGVAAAAITVGGIALAVNHSSSKETDSKTKEEQTEQDGNKNDTETGQNTAPDNNNHIETILPGTYLDRLYIYGDDYGNQYTATYEVITDYEMPYNVDKDGNYYTLYGEKLEFAVKPAVLCKNSNQFAYWDEEGNFYIYPFQTPHQVAKDILYCYADATNDNYTFFSLNGGHLYYSSCDETQETCASSIQLKPSVSNSDLDISNAKIQSCYINKTLIVIWLEDGSCYYADWTKRGFLKEDLYVTPLENADKVYAYSQKYMFSDTFDTPIYSKRGDDKHLYFIYTNSENNKINATITLPENYTTKDIKQAYANNGGLAVIFSDGGVYYANSLDFTDDTPELQQLDVLSKLNKEGHVRSIVNFDNGQLYNESYDTVIADYISIKVLMDDLCYYEARCLPKSYAQ